MSVPTSTWGNTGYTLGFPTALTQTQQATSWSSFPGPTATVPGSSDGPPLGQAIILPDYTTVQALVAGATTAFSLATKVSTAVAWQNNFTVIPTAAANDLVVAINDRSGISLSANYFTWFTIKGLAFPLTLNATAAGKIVAASGVSGQLYGATAGTDLQGTMVNTVLVGASPAASPVLMI